MAQLESFGAIEAVRRRPGMYFGNVHDGTGLHHLVWEVVANTLDQVLAGHATTLDLVMHTDGSVSVVSINLVDPHYGEPTKSRLESPEAEGIVEELVHQGLARALEEDRSLREHVAECLASPA